MNIELLKKLGNLDQIAGLRETRLIGGRKDGVRATEVVNAAGLRFTVVPDRCMDLYDLSYKGVNLAFHSKNGILSPEAFSAVKGEFCDQWSAGAMVTCGLDNVSGQCGKENFVTHGRIGFLPAEHYGTDSRWEGENLILEAKGEIYQTRMFGRSLSLKRCITTGLYDKTIRVSDTITNYTDAAEPFMLLYHCNFGYPLLDEDTRFVSSSAQITQLNGECYAPASMSLPIDGAGEEVYLYRMQDKCGWGAVINERLGLGVAVSFKTEQLPHMMEWKRMKSHDYVTAIEPCNTWGINREEALKEEKIAVLPAYGTVETGVEFRILDGKEEIERFTGGR